ncbi:MAG: PAS domain-containing protein [Magnetovibrionaceae bacterium]
MPAFLAALEALPMSATVADMEHPDQPLVFVNKAFTDATGYSASEALGRNCRFLQGAGTSPDTVDQIRDALREGRSCDLDILNYRKSGEAFWNNLKLSPVTDDKGRVTHYIGIQNDVSTLMSASRANAERRRMEAMEVAFRGFRHEINNLIHPLINFARFSKETLEELGGDTRFIDGVMEAARSITALTEERLFLGLSSADSDGVCDLVDRVSSEVRFFSLGGGKANPRIDLQTDLKTALVPLSTIQANVILSNLLLNACRATPSEGSIRVLLDESGKSEIALTVEDTGCGMDAETLDRIYEPYFTTQPGRRSGPEGIGLGMTNVYNIVTTTGGRIQATSKRDCGTRIDILLPKVADGQVAMGRPKQTKRANESADAGMQELRIHVENLDC